MVRIQTIFSSALMILLLSMTAFAQSSAVTGTLRGVVRVEPSGAPARNAVVTIAQLKKMVLTDESGAFELTDLPIGRYQIIAHLAPRAGRGQNHRDHGWRANC